MNFHSSEIDALYETLKTSSEGLDIAEVNNRLCKYGKNRFKEVKKKSNIVKFFNQFKDLMIIVLLLASLFSFIIAVLNNESFIDSIIIIAIVILNAIIGFVQELRADKAIDSLVKMQVTNVRVRRNGNLYIVNSEDIVPGDILVLEAGDTVPADSRLIWDASLKVDESSLTGESEPVLKEVNTLNSNVVLAERSNMIYQGTNIVYGKCEAIVCLTGGDTEFGKIANSLNQKEEKLTPLQEKVNSISKVLSIIIAVIILIMFIIGMIKNMKFVEIVMLSISLAVAAIPEGLPAVITIVLSIGVNDLAKKKAIVRKISSVETLGSTEIICSDKTGTITQNKITVQELFYNNEFVNASKFDSNSLLAKMMILNNDATMSDGKYIGDPTEIAPLEFLEKSVNIKKIRKENKRIDELPFDSDRKMMSTINRNGESVSLYVKGSFDSIIDRCSYIYSNNKIVKLTKKKKQELKEIENLESDKAYRLLVYAYKKLNDNYVIDSNLEDNLVFVGMVSMVDPPRDDVKEAIELCKQAHVRPIMITGDSLRTARAIAKNVGISNDDNSVISGSDLDKMSFSELKRNVDKYSVYARVSPINKLNIVNAWKENGKVVAMTGDGVNDAPALKVADIGVGMGISGTEVSKSVSDIVLTDDSFSSIVTAVREGRRIFDNIRNVLVYLLVGNIAEVIVVFIGMAVGLTIFSPLQLLYINLITDSIPALALAFEKESDDVMKRNVRRNDGTFFTPFLVSKICISAILETIAILFVYAVCYRNYGNEVATTVSFLTLMLSEMISAYTCKNLKKNVIGPLMFNNKVLNRSMILLGIVQLLIFFTPLKHVFSITKLGFVQIIFSFLIIVLIFVIDEVSKNIITEKFSD